MFYCRDRELGELNKRYENGKFECMVIYGRRRVGKTALINEFCKDKPTVFFSALKAASKENLEALSLAVYTKDHPEAVTAPVFRGYDEALSAITQMAKDGRLVFVIDEYPYLARSEASISSRLQHVIDHVWQNSRLFLILCGSSVSFMEQQVLGGESPLYGRRTGQIKIKALTYKELSVFNPKLTNEQQALIYGITGGIPHYINKLDVGNDIDDALKQNLFNTAAYLFEEPENLLKQELREPAVYNTVISAIAGGASRLNEISTRSGLTTDVCSKYLKVLTDLCIISKDTPVSEKPGKKTIYRIGDNFFRFWYRFVPMQYSAISAGHIDRIYDAVIKRYLPDYMGLIFEQMCRTYLLDHFDDLPVILSDVGEWWGTDAEKKKEIQIDIVGAPATGDSYIIGSCKYRNTETGVDELELLKEYAKVFGKGSKYYYYIFSKTGFTKGLKAAASNEDVTLVTLDDMYK